MSNLIIPACGKSSRYPGLRPKWLLTHPSGNAMLTECIKGLNHECKNIFIAVLKEHVDQYGFVDGILDQINDPRAKFVVLDKPTKDQPETILQVIQKEKVTGQIYCKDTDNYFSSDLPNGNFVSTIDLCNSDLITPNNKSYIKTNNLNCVVNIVEKKVVSSRFCCGLYGFEDAEEYVKYYESIYSISNDMYLSDIIHKMILDNKVFNEVFAKDYIDWGTSNDWDRFRSEYKVVFLDIDGVLVENSCGYMKPFVGTTKGISPNVKHINKLFDSGKSQIILTTARKEKHRAETVDQLNREGIPYHQLVMGLYHAKRIVVNDYSKSNPYKSCEAINMRRNSDFLEDLL